MIRAQMNREQREELERFRGKASSRNSEKALMVLMNDEGKSAERIARELNRNPHSVRHWLKRYLADGVAGLERRYSPGRPRKKREVCKKVILEVLPKSPQEFNYPELVWSIPLLRHYLEAMHKVGVSEDTIIRGLQDLGYSYKRPSKTVAPCAPSPEEKRAAVTAMLDEIKKLIEREPCEILISDESHFSNEPYLVRGWFKKRWPPQNSKWKEKGRLHHIWVLEFKKWAFLLEAIQAG